MVKYSVLFIILCCGLWLRVAAIHYGLPSKNLALTSYHPDEPKSFYSLEKMRQEKNLNPGDGLYWGSLHLYTLGAALQVAKWVGYVVAPSREFLIQNLGYADRLYMVGRLVSVFFGVASIFLMDALVAALLGPWYGLLAAFLLAVAPVHFINSFVVRPDIMMLFWMLCTLWFALQFNKNPRSVFCILAGICAGWAGATKYNGGLIVAVPFFVILLGHFSIKNIVLLGIACAVSFLAACPYVLLDFKTWISYMQANRGLVDVGREYLLYGPGWKSYWTIFLPYGLGVFTTVLSGSGIIFFSINLLRNFFVNSETNSETKLETKNYFLAFFLGFAALYIVTVLPRHQMVWYTLPMVPFIIFFAVYAIKVLRQTAGLWSCGILVFGLVLYNVPYAMAQLSLYRNANVRELASAWMEQIIPAGKKIAITRSYSWTPGILRQYHPPYQILEGGSSQSIPRDCVLGLPVAAASADFLVLTELETAPFVAEPISKIYPEPARVLQQWIPQNFEEKIVFEIDAEWMGISFPKSEKDPDDWKMPNPRITIYKRKI